MHSPDTKLITCIPHEANDYQANHIEIDEYEEETIEEDEDTMIEQQDSQQPKQVVSFKKSTTTVLSGEYDHIIAKCLAITSSSEVTESPPQVKLSAHQSHPTPSQAHNQHVSPMTQGRILASQLKSQPVYSSHPDERFLLSCLPIFQRLSNKQNALARLKIQQLLFKIEFNSDFVGGTAS